MTTRELIALELGVTLITELREHTLDMSNLSLTSARLADRNPARIWLEVQCSMRSTTLPLFATSVDKLNALNANTSQTATEPFVYKLDYRRDLEAVCEELWVIDSASQAYVVRELVLVGPAA